LDTNDFVAYLSSKEQLFQSGIDKGGWGRGIIGIVSFQVDIMISTVSFILPK
jgi:hypothetical protein